MLSRKVTGQIKRCDGPSAVTPAGGYHEQRAVLGPVEQPAEHAGAAQHRLQLHALPTASLPTIFHSPKCSQPAVTLPPRLWLPFERMISALYQKRWGMVSW